MIATPLSFNTIGQSPLPLGDEQTRIVRGERGSAASRRDHLVSVHSDKPAPRLNSKVRFDLTPRLHFGRAELTEEEKKAMFWDPVETKRQARLDALRYMKEHNDKDMSSVGTSTTPYEESVNRALEVCCSSGRIENAPMVSSSPYRGLEQFLVHRMTDTRVRCIRRLLKAQDMLPANLAPDQHAVLLCGVSKSLTRPSRRMGQLVAIGDAKVAASSLGLVV